MRGIDFTFRGTTPIILMRKGGQNQDAILDVGLFNGENKLWKKQMKPYSAAYQENIKRY